MLIPHKNSPIEEEFLQLVSAFSLLPPHDPSRYETTDGYPTSPKLTMPTSIHSPTNHSQPPAHQLLWNRKGAEIGAANLTESYQRLLQNPTLIQDLAEVIDWSKSQSPARSLILPDLPSTLELHGAYSSTEINAIFGKKPTAAVSTASMPNMLASAATMSLITTMSL